MTANRKLELILMALDNALSETMQGFVLTVQ